MFLDGLDAVSYTHLLHALPATTLPYIPYIYPKTIAPRQKFFLVPCPSYTAKAATCMPTALRWAGYRSCELRMNLTKHCTLPSISTDW